MTGAVTEAADRLDVCSVCGDRPAPVYDLVETPFLSVRLCADCAAIQTAAFGLRVCVRQPEG